jgi:hypothetical protein
LEEPLVELGEQNQIRGVVGVGSCALFLMSTAEIGINNGRRCTREADTVTAGLCSLNACPKTSG